MLKNRVGEHFTWETRGSWNGSLKCKRRVGEYSLCLQSEQAVDIGPQGMGWNCQGRER